MHETSISIISEPRNGRLSATAKDADGVDKPLHHGYAQAHAGAPDTRPEIEEEEEEEEFVRIHGYCRGTQGACC